ncbi:uncharacterized protein LOC124271261 [Haliotis rubra]|uniref:uncharacterized protein LOC124271261 n=1 Tax=Haliotis rubra TaxID=36100 RepID=UPI001EE5F09C|nr:uncharacterized protein LOC124271261 [Haliotis rubra]
MAGVRIFVVVVLLQWIQLTSGSCQAGKFGESCSYSCHCGTSCDKTTGACSGSCDRGWTKEGGLCQTRNIALSKTTSTTPEAYVGWPASNAVDGDSDTGGEGRTCFHAGGSPSDWTVDLGRDFQLYDIRIYSRGGYYGRNVNSNIYLNNDASAICSTLPTSSTNPTDVTCNGTGRYVTIWNPGTGGHDGCASALNICEGEIYACSPGIYGVNCNVFCHCLDSTCDRLTGLCPGNCTPGWQGERCDTACYGTNCNKTCAGRKCSSPNSSCDRHTGACDTDCLPGWIEVDCTQGCSRGNYGANCTSLCSERNCPGNSSCDHVTGSCDSGCKAGWMGADCKEAEDIGMYMNVGFDNNENTSTTQIQVSKQNKYQGDSDKAAASTTGTKDTGKGGTGDLDLQKVEEEEDYDVSDQPEDVKDTPEVPDRNYYNLDDNGRTHVIPVSELQTKVEEMTPASAEEEFKRLPDGYVHSYAESQQPKNKGKNRFRGYYPYDYNRVVLHGVSEDKDKDYINASYLDGYKAEKRYIPAQGPYRPEVVVDFWRMIYQEQSTTIVMVTGTCRGGEGNIHMKCLQYWPENGTSIYGDISVTKETETQLANYSHKTVCSQEGKIHHVHHFHFTSWPDHGVPDTFALLEFMWRVKVTTRHKTQPIIVHCSAGIGRTGTYIAIESLVDQAAAEGCVDVVSFVSNMRGQRKNMIQTKEQYLFLYQAVAMAVAEGDTSLDGDAIRQIDPSHLSSVTMGKKERAGTPGGFGKYTRTFLPVRNVWRLL